MIDPEVEEARPREPLLFYRHLVQFVFKDRKAILKCPNHERHDEKSPHKDNWSVEPYVVFAVYEGGGHRSHVIVAWREARGCERREDQPRLYVDDNAGGKGGFRATHRRRRMRVGVPAVTNINIATKPANRG